MTPTAKKKRAEPAVKLPAELTQARRFGKTRSAQSGALLEDYVELIDDLLTSNGEARPTDVARRLGVSHATAIKTIARLKRGGLATGRPYRGVFLTEDGQKLAARVRVAASAGRGYSAGPGRSGRSRGSRRGRHRALCLGGFAESLRAVPGVARATLNKRMRARAASKRNRHHLLQHPFPFALGTVGPLTGLPQA